MPYSSPLNNQKNQSRSSYAWDNLGAFAKATTVFVTAVGGYVLARASGVFSGWGSEATEANALDLQREDSLSNKMTLPSFKADSQTLLQSELTAFSEMKIKLEAKEANSIEPLASQSGHRHKRAESVIGNEFPVFPVNAYTLGSEWYPAIASLTNGNVMVVWAGAGRENSSGVFGQVLTAKGIRVGAEFQVNTYTRYSSTLTLPDLTLLSNGDVMVVWGGAAQNGTSYGVYGQVLTATGTKIGAEFQVNTYVVSASMPVNPTLTLLSDGNVMVVWQNLEQSGSDYGIYAQLLTANGTQIEAEFSLNTYTLGHQENSAITSLANGNVMVAWQSYGQDGNSTGIYGQVLNMSGAKEGAEFQVNTYTLDNQSNPALKTLSDGNVIVVWNSNGQDGNGYGIYGQVLTASGIQVGTEFPLNTYTEDHQWQPALTILANGNVLIVWVSEGQIDGRPARTIYGQVLTASGNKVGAEFPVNTYAINQVPYPALALFGDGNVMAAWRNEGEEDNNIYRIYGRVLPFAFTLIKNELLIYQGQSMLLNAANLYAKDLANGNSDNSLLFYVSNIQQGYFSFSHNPAVSILGFYQQNITDGQVIFNHNGSSLPPAYEVSVSNGIETTLPAPAAVKFITTNLSGAEFRVNTNTLDPQRYSAMTPLANGQVMVIWASSGQDGSGYGIYGQVLAIDGTRVGTEFPVNTYTLNDQTYPAVTLLADGDVMVLWASSGQDGSGYGIYGQVLTSNGTQVGLEFPVNTNVVSDQDYPAIALLPNGDVMALWEGQDGSFGGICGQVLMANGTQVGAEFRVNTQTSNSQISPALTLLPDGNVMVIWQSAPPSGNTGEGIYGQVLTATGSKVGTQFSVNAYKVSYFTVPQISPAIITLANGNVMVVSESTGKDGSDYGIYGQVLTTAGVKIGTEFPVNTYTLNKQYQPALTLLADGNVMALWESYNQDGSDYGVYSQVLTATGVKVGAEFRINAYTASYQGSAANAALANGNVLVTWTSDGQDGSYHGIYGRVISTIPVLQINQLTLEEGQTLTLNNTHINAVDINDSPGNLQFAIRNLRQGSFKRVDTGLQVEQFIQQDITTGLIQFIHDGGEIAPSYEVAVSDGVTPFIWHTTAINFTRINDVPLLATNVLTLEEGQRLTLTRFNIEASDEETPSGDLLFNISNVQHGLFTWLNATISVNQFYQQNITDGRVQFVHDGTENAPVYAVSVSDGQQATATVNATINFNPVNDAPLLLANSLNIKEGDSVILSEENVNATDEETPDVDFMFSAEQVRFGEFRRASFSGSEVVTTFTRQQINSQFIQFVHDGSDNPPSYQIRVSDGVMTSVPQAANVTFIPIHDPEPVIPIASAETDTTRLLSIILGVTGSGLLVFSIIAGVLVKRYRDQQKRVKQDQIELKDLKQRLRFMEVLTGGNLDDIRQNLRADKVGESGRSIIGGKWALMNKIKREEAQMLEAQTGYMIPFKDNETEVEVRIGSGYFGKVRLALNVEIEGEYAGRFVGVKKIKGEDKIKASLQEATIQSKLSDVVHIMPLYDAKETEGNKGQRTLYQFMLFAGFGSGEVLKAALAKLSVEQREAIVLQIAHQLLRGFAGMHGKGIYHCDFKPSNMVLDNQGKAYIIDFGCAIELGTGKERVTDYNSDLGDFNYFSAERLAFYRHGKQGVGGAESYSALLNDMWTLGLTLYELMANEHLLQQVELEEEIEQKGDEFILNYLRGRPAFRNPDKHPLWRLIEGLLSPEPKRLTAKQALKQFFGKAQDMPFTDDQTYQLAFAEVKSAQVESQPVSPTLTGVKGAEKYSDKKEAYEYAKDVDISGQAKKTDKEAYLFAEQVLGLKQEQSDDVLHEKAETGGRYLNDQEEPKDGEQKDKKPTVYKENPGFVLFPQPRAANQPSTLQQGISPQPTSNSNT